MAHIRKQTPSACRRQVRRRSRRLRVLLADDHAMFRQALKALLERHQISIVAEAADGREALELAQKYKPDVVVLDLSMPIMSGLETARELTRAMPSIATILLTMHDEEAYVIEAMKAGVRGYVLKAQAADDLLDAIHQAARGEVYLSSGLSERVVQAFNHPTAAMTLPLTGRERQVLQLVAEGKTSKEISRVLAVSVKTAESHRMRMMNKINVHDTAGLVRYAIRNGFVSS